ncbi:putative permease [Maioricimonas rarisocia]|uniref:Putative permease n=1 Tax=Maioricimonas rarisocia TaxID=2528026 RepID=A0A517Z681_9PLAN|nr:permease [Maioricimonas rarisocia]QDU38000.1 putative permease [Maioricimonas rarisocia]
MTEVLIWSFVLRLTQAFIAASPFILAGLIVAGIFRRLMGRESTRRLFGGSSGRSHLQAWGLGMLLPICSLGVIPVIRELRGMGLRGGTILAFAMAAPLFNPLSVLYGLTLSEPIAIVAFAFCSLIVVTGVGMVWDRLFPESSQTEEEPAPVGAGLKRMLAIGVAAARQAGGASALYILAGLIGVALLGVIVPPGALQHAMNGDNPLAPLTMTAAAIPVYATPMLAMSQLGMMFQHANSPGAAFVLLALGAGMNLGLVIWMWRQYGLRRSAAWMGLLLVVVLGLAYGVDRPLYPHAIDPADHTHAFDIYCRPFYSDNASPGAAALATLRRDTKPYELYPVAMLGLLVAAGLLLNLLDRQGRIEHWLEAAPQTEVPRRFDVVLPGPVLGGIALVGLVITSIVGCYAYYPPPAEVLEEMNVVKAEALGSALSEDASHATYWIEVYDDWSRKLEVGAFLRDWQLSDYHRMKARILREQLELLEHEIEHQDHEEVQRLVAKVSRSQSRLKTAFLEER